MKRFLLPLLILFSIAANSQTIRQMNRKTPARTDSTYLQNGTSQMGTIGDLSDFIQDTSKLTSKASRDKLKDSLQANITANAASKLSVSDSTIYSTKANYKKGMDSTGALMAAKLALSDSTIYSSKANYKKGADSIGALIGSDTTNLGAAARANTNATNTVTATNATNITNEIANRTTAQNAYLVTSSVYTSGSTYTVPNNTPVVVINPSSTTAALAVTLPATPLDGQEQTFVFGGTMTSGTVVTSFSAVANSGQTLLQSSSPSSVNAGEAIKYRYISSLTKWYRIL